MNIYDFLNSRSIAEHWKKIDYQPDSLETAWIVYFNSELTLSEKWKYWEEIINTMPDMEIIRRPNCPHYDSLHGFLNRFMALSRRFIDWFYDYTNSVYTLKAADNDYLFDAVFSSMDSLKDFISSEGFEDVDSFVVQKTEIDDYHRWPASLKLNKELKSICQDTWDYGSFPCNKEEDDILLAFEGMWFDFPVPFKKGDVIYNPYYKCGFDASEINGRTELFVVHNVGLECVSKKDKKWFFEGKNGDSTDMVFSGYTQWRDGTVYRETFSNYMDFEFYNGDFEGTQRIIKALSNYEKGLINAEMLMHAYHQILSEERAKNDIPVFFTHEDLELAGINIDKIDGLKLSHTPIV